MPDRPMTPELAAALDALTAAQRRVLPALAVESGHEWLAALLLGLAAEVLALERRAEIARMNEITVLHGHVLDHLTDVDKAAEGADWSHVPAPAPRTVAWFPWDVPDTIEGLEP
jgi:hypothetical protein